MSNVVLARRLAAAAALAVFLVIVASAWLRHAQAGPGCTPWPACYGAVNAPLPATGGFAARLVHRLAASTALILIALVPFLALRKGTGYDVERRLAWLALVVALSLAVLGIATPGARVPAVALGNLGGGFAMFATLVVLVTRLAPPRAGGCRRLATVALVVASMQVAAGGMIGAQFALTACPAALDCPGADLASLAGALDPLRPLDVVGGHVRPVEGAAALVVLHRYLSTGVLLLAGAVAWSARSNPALAGTIAATTVLAAAAGMAATLAQTSLAATLVHNALAAILVAVLAVAAFRRRGSAAGPQDDRTR